jgi:hypothetical protein
MYETMVLMNGAEGTCSFNHLPHLQHYFGRRTIKLCNQLIDQTHGYSSAPQVHHKCQE